MHFLFAPLWGRWSDRVGRKPLVLIGIAGYAIAQALFGLANSLWLFYGARIIGGILTSAMFPAVTAYVADVTTEDERSRGMAWEGTAVSLGVVFGPAAHQVAVGFVLMGLDLAVLLFTRSTPFVLIIVGLLALGLWNAANSLGQAAGPGLGGLLFALDMRAAYLITGTLLVAAGIISGSVVQRGNIGRSDEQT